MTKNKLTGRCTAAASIHSPVFSRHFPHALFFASGASGLGLQIAWTKMFSAGLGHEVPAMLAVVSAFLGGMAVGAWALDHRISTSATPRRWYAWLQLGIGGWAAFVSFLIPHLNALAVTLIGARTTPLHQAIVSFALPFAALLPATAAMGATLPAMERWLASRLPEGRPLARAYAWNTAGAVGGTLVTTFFLAPTLGFLACALVLAAMNLLCGLSALNSTEPSQPPLAPSNASPPPPAPVARLLVTAFVTGLLGIGFEMVSVRVMAQALENTLYTFAVALAVYLLGTALGAAAYQRLRETKPFELLLGKLLCALALACIGEAWVMARIPSIYDGLRQQLGDRTFGVVASEFIIALAVFLLPTLLMGATFAHLIAAAKTRHGGIGRAAATNTLGGALAGVIFGVVLVPAIGAKWALVALAAGYLLVLPTLRGGVWMGAVAWAGLLLVLPPDLHLVRLPPGAKVRDYRDGVMATVIVLETADGHRSLRVNNRFQMGGTAAALAERRQAHIPLLLHPAPKRALFLGPGTGITLGAASLHPGLIADGVELVPEVIELLHHFAPENMGTGATSRVIAADARRFVRASDERYDVIVADLFHPAQDGAGFLYTREHFQAVRKRLTPGGIFCQWLPLHQLDERTLNTIVRTFLNTFSHTHAVLLHFNVDIPVLGLVGSLEPLRLAPDAVEPRLTDPAFRQQMKAAGLDRTINLLGCFAAGPRQLSFLASSGLLNTDDNPAVSFTAPRIASLHERQPHELLLSFLACNRFVPSETLAADPEAAKFAPRLSDFIAARDLYLRGLASEADGRLTEAMERYFESTSRSLYFTPAYARLVSIIQIMARADRESARRLFDRLQQAQPAQPLGQQMLGPLFKPD